MGILLLSKPIVRVYEGIVATRGQVMVPDTIDTTNKQAMSRKVHISTEPLTSIRLAFSGFFAGLPDAAIGANTTITASVEYPAGTFTQIMFAGSPSGTITDGSILFSDYLSVSIPTLTPFWVRTFIANSAGLVCLSGRNTFYGEAAAIAVSGLSDQTMAGTITDSGTNRVIAPLAILGMTNNPSVIVLGDSINRGASQDGTGEQNTDGTSAAGFDGRIGMIPKCLSSTFPFLNLAISGDNATNWITNATARKLLIQKSSHLICQLGVNDFGNLSKTSAQTISSLAAIYALARQGQKIFQTTTTPQSTSTDSWATTANQTPVNSTGHSTFNSALRAVTTGLPLTGIYDMASVVESSTNSDLWAVNGVAFFGTGDGIHPNNYSRFVNSGLVGPFIWPCF